MAKGASCAAQYGPPNRLANAVIASKAMTATINRRPGMRIPSRRAMAKTKVNTSVVDANPRKAGPRRAQSLACGHKKTLARSEEHTSELQSLMRISYAVFCLKYKKRERHTKHKTRRR